MTSLQHQVACPLALPPASLVPWGVWVAKSHLLFDECYEIYWIVFDRMVDYFRPVVMETLDAAARCLDGKFPKPGSISARDSASS